MSGGEAPTGGAGAAAAVVPAGPPAVHPARLVATLALAGALAGLLLVLVHQATQPAIQRHKAAVLRAAVLEVLGTQQYRTLYVVDGALRDEPPAGAKEADLAKLYLGLDEAGRPDGFAVPAQKAGFQDQVVLIFGYDPTAAALRGMKVLSNKETPGLGDRIEIDPAFTGQFAGRSVPLVGVKPGRGSGDPREVDTITGATISSRTVIAAINEALERARPLIEGYEPPEAGR